MQQLKIEFAMPNPIPQYGFLVRYREVGTTDYTDVEPYPTSSPVIINVPDNKNWEGTIQSYCGDKNTSEPVAWTASSGGGSDPNATIMLPIRNSTPNELLVEVDGQPQGVPAGMIQSFPIKIGGSSTIRITGGNGEGSAYMFVLYSDLWGTNVNSYPLINGADSVIPYSEEVVGYDITP